MTRLPTPGPGRPQHPSYSEPGPTMTLLEAAILVLLIALVAGLLVFGKGVI